jgi:hypothetical protein
LLRRLASEDPDGRRIVPLAFHVDYWNNLGWRDLYSDADWTRRQGRYVEALGGATLFTPQLIVHGRESVVGSDEARLFRSIQTLTRDSQSHSISISISEVRIEGQVWQGRATVSPEHAAAGSELRLVTALFENGLKTSVTAGENAGRSLDNDYVVRAVSTEPNPIGAQSYKRIQRARCIRDLISDRRKLGGRSVGSRLLGSGYKNDENLWRSPQITPGGVRRFGCPAQKNVQFLRLSVS